MRNFYLNKRGYLVLFFALLVGLLNAQVRVYVTTGGSDFTSVGAHGSWTNATSDLQAAINGVADVGGGEIWVGAGTFYPTESYYDVEDTDPDYDAALAARSVSFMMRNGVSVIGGFNGEEDLESRSNYGYEEANATILSGNIGDSGDETDNAFHVVYGNDYTDDSAMLTDLVITRGYANGSGRNGRGGGIQTRNGGTYTNITIVDNEGNLGGGVYAYKGGAFINCTFLENVAREFNIPPMGGGIYMHLGQATLTDCIFNHNRSTGDAGAVGITSGEVNRCVFVNNYCGSKGGAVYSYPDDDGGVTTDGGVFKNCLFANNTSWEDGGAIFAHRSGTWTNCTVVNNFATVSGGGIYGFDGATFTNVVVWSNECTDSPASSEVRFADGGTYTNCAIGGLTNFDVGTDLLSLNLTNSEVDGPQFISPSITNGRGDSPSDITQNMAANWQLGFNSPLVDMGIADITGLDLDGFDLAQNTRVIQNRIDIGAYELEYFLASVTATGNGTVSETEPIRVAPGGSVSIDFTPDANHHIYTFTVNGVDRMGDLTEDTGVYTFADNNVQGNLDIVVEFLTLTTYDITVTGDVGGDVTPPGTTPVYEGLNFSLTLDPSNGYGLRSILVDGVEQVDNAVDNADGTYTFEILAVDADHSVVVDFALVHTITINISAGGTANYNGSVEIMEGNSIELQLTRQLGYKLRYFVRGLIDLYSSVVDNGDGTYNYTISDVTEDITYSATFELYHNVTISASAGGSVSNAGANEVFQSASLPVQIELEEGYKFTDITLDGVDIMGDVTDNGDDTYSYSVEGLTADVELAVTFTKFEVLTISAGSGGAVSPTGANDILEGEELQVTITPDAGYEVASLTFNGDDDLAAIVENTDGTFTYTVQNLTANATLDIQFTLSTGFNTIDGESIQFYPNPADTEIFCDVQLSEIRIFDVTGNLVKSIDDDGLTQKVIVGNLSNGVYFVSYTTQSNAKGVQKLIIKH